MKNIFEYIFIDNLREEWIKVLTILKKKITQMIKKKLLSTIFYIYLKKV